MEFCDNRQVPNTPMNTNQQFPIFIQQSDGITAAVCRVFEIGGIGRDRESACKEVYDAIITNSKIILNKVRLKEPLASIQEEALKDKADFFLENQSNISSFFICKDL